MFLLAAALAQTRLHVDKVSMSFLRFDPVPEFLDVSIGRGDIYISSMEKHEKDQTILSHSVSILLEQ